MLDGLRESGALPRSELRLARAAVLAERARIALERGQGSAAFEYARQADRLRPNWVPSLLLAGRALALQDRPREAASLIEKAWIISPHPQLGALYLSLKTGKSEARKAQSAEHLAKRSGNNPISRMLVAEALLKAGILAQARYTAKELAKEYPSADTYGLMARIEQADHQPAEAQIWRDRAAAAPPSEAWLCTSCRQPHKNWQATCSACKGFNTLVWEKPPVLIGQ
ncbi:MAG TPA: hypothetical protein VHB73_08435, partial [Alphaproteobacteria bacterium]|nr:hypothetical protein [Alphaproteobacteria bacterium]